MRRELTYTCNQRTPNAQLPSQFDGHWTTLLSSFPRLLCKNICYCFYKYGTIILRGWCEPSGAKLCRLSLRPKDHPLVPPEWSSGPTALKTHDLKIVGALFRYLHAATGFPAKSTWLVAIEAGNYASWSGLTYANANKY